MKINIIGDIAGRYDELLALLAKMPEADLIISVGDMIDRGEKSRQVLEWFMKTPNAIGIYGNHESMMVNYCRDPDDWNNRAMWLNNGGRATLESFKEPGSKHIDIPEEMVEWLESCPLWWKNDEIVITHAPMLGDVEDLPDQYRKEGSHYFVWNRHVPYKRIGDVFHVYGHNGELRMHSDDAGDYALCIDNSWHGELTGMHWPTKEIFHQEYLPKKEDLEKQEELKKILDFENSPN